MNTVFLYFKNRDLQINAQVKLVEMKISYYTSVRKDKMKIERYCIEIFSSDFYKIFPREPLRGVMNPL